MKVSQLATLLEQRKRFRNLYTFWEYRKVKRNEIERDFKDFTGWIYILNDFHIPYTRYDLLFDTLGKIAKNKDKKLCVINGDLLNFDLFSVFPKKANYTASPSKTLETAVKLLTVMNEIFDDIIYTGGANHEIRLEKFITKSISGIKEQSETLKMFQSLEDTFNAIPKVIFLDDFLVKIGDVAMMHPEGGSRAIAGRTASWVARSLAKRMKNLKVVIVGHTHKQSKLWEDRILVIETGYLAKTFDYTRTAKSLVSYGKYGLSHLGYGLCYMNKGKVDINSANFINLGFEEGL